MAGTRFRCDADDELKAVADFHESQADAGFDGAQGDGEFFGNFDVGQAVEEGQFDGVFLIVGEFGEGLADVGGVFAGDGEVFGPVFGIGGVGEVVADGFEDDAGAAGAEAVEDAGAGDHHDPGFGAAAGGVVVGGLTDLDEDVLGDVFGGGAVAEHADGEGEDDGAHEVVAAGESRMLAAIGPTPPRPRPCHRCKWERRSTDSGFWRLTVEDLLGRGTGGRGAGMGEAAGSCRAKAIGAGGS